MPSATAPDFGAVEPVRDLYVAPCLERTSGRFGCSGAEGTGSPSLEPLALAVLVTVGRGARRPDSLARAGCARPPTRPRLTRQTRTERSGRGDDGAERRPARHPTAGRTGASRSAAQRAGDNGHRSATSPIGRRRPRADAPRKTETDVAEIGAGAQRRQTETARRGHAGGRGGFAGRAGGDEVGGCALEHDPAAIVAGTGAEVDDPVGVRHDRLVVLDDVGLTARLRCWMLRAAGAAPAGAAALGAARCGVCR